MFFIPYKFDLNLNRVPWLTIFVTLLCIVIYTQQHLNAAEFVTKTELFCLHEPSRIEQMAMQKALGNASPAACVELMYELTIADDPEAVIADYAANSRRFAGLGESDSRKYIQQIIADKYRSYRSLVPPLKTRELWYAPQSWDPVTMVTSSFSHGDWAHLIGNLVFFYAFAAAVELIVGTIAFFLVIMAMAFGTNIAYSLAMLHVDDPLPTVGLSGIVMGMMAMLAYFMPTAKIRCFYWILIRIGTIAVPAWILALFYIGFDVFTLLTEDELGGVNIIAHISGAVLGLAMAVLLFREQKRRISIY